MALFGKFKIKIYEEGQPIDKYRANNITDLENIIKGLKKKYGEK